MTPRITTNNKLENYVDKPFLGLFSKKYHRDLAAFLQKFIPSLLPKEIIDNGGSWTAYGISKFPPSSRVSHSLIFTKHPYLKLKIDKAAINISHIIYDDPNWSDSNFEFDLCFTFWTREAAHEFYKSINAILSSFKVDKKTSKYKGLVKTTYTDEKSEKYFNKIEIMLAKDLLSQRLSMLPTIKGPRFISVYNYVVKLQLPKL